MVRYIVLAYDGTDEPFTNRDLDIPDFSSISDAEAFIKDQKEIDRKSGFEYRYDISITMTEKEVTNNYGRIREVD